MPDRLLERSVFDRICDDEGGISDKEALLDFLHHSGVIFYRPGLFGGRIVLDQNWALEAIYAVFDRKKTLPLFRGDGRFSRALLERLVWPTYTGEEQEVFLGMMESCGICFRARELRDHEWEYIAPELLPAKSEAQETLLPGRLLKSPPAAEAEARYPFLHEGVLRNYLSRIGTQAGDAAIYWKYGCWFYEKNTDSRVLIDGQWQEAEKESGEGTIRFRAWGNGARKLIEPLLTELQRLPIGQQPTVTWTNSGGTPPEENNQRLENLEPTQTLQPASGTPDVYVSYAWGQSEKVVDDMCDVMEAEGWRVIRDKTAMQYGDRISDFMKCLSRGDLIVVVLSAKYLRSNYCMTELHGVYQRTLGDKGEFLDRIIPVSLDDAKLASWRDRTEIARHWEEEFQEMEKSFRLLGQQDFGLYKSMQDWHNRVGDILAYTNDVLRPHGFESIVKDDFAALRQMLRARRAW
jgi:internalin A